METRLKLSILPQPDNFTCGPTCLHAVYHYYGDDIPLEKLIEETPRLENGGILGVDLARHALRRGYEATIYTYNLQLFDPTWRKLSHELLTEKLKSQAEAKSGQRMLTATSSYIDYLKLGGRLSFEDLTPTLIRKYLKKGVPILTGLSATYLYQESREKDPEGGFDDVRGLPMGHFVVLCGYRREERKTMVADPFHPNPMSPAQLYEVDMSRLIGAILLGVLTYDANLLILKPGARGGA